MYSKTDQLKKKRKPKIGPTRKEERKQAKLEKWEQHDRPIYEAIAERSYDPIANKSMCEICHKRPAEQMHHVIPRSRGETSLENVKYVCLECHGEVGHHLKIIRN